MPTSHPTPAPATGSRSRSSGGNFTPARLEAFSDGVIAVIITIMVLELKVPRENGIPGLRLILPTVLVYLLSFAFTGIYWVNHHHLLHRTEETDGRILYSNLAFLFFLSLLPFATSWISDKHIDSFSVALYTTCLIIVGAAFFLLRLAIARRLRLAGEFAEEDQATQRKHVTSLGLYVLAILAARTYPRAALLLDAAVTIVWILPGLGTHQHGHPPASQTFS